MNVLYLFREPGYLRIPYVFYNQALFNGLLSAGGEWDNVCNTFIFWGDIDKEYFVDIFQKFLPKRHSMIPVVQVLENSHSQPLISGFLDHPLEVSPEQSSIKKVPPCPVSVSLPEKLSVQLQEKLENELRAGKYSVKTRRAYNYYNRLLCRNLQKLPEEIQADDIKQFLADIEKDRDYSAASINLAISAIKFFYKRVMQKDILKDQRRPRQDKRLPVVLSKEEIKKLFMKEKNFKHRLLLMMVYASGLRVSEVVCLKRRDIDVSRKLINIRSAKGRKDRYTLVSEAVIGALDEYYSQYNISNWLFCGYDPDKHISIRSAQYIFEDALKEAEIIKTASIHCLRHSFATHLLETGIDIRYIQELLGHTSVRTTERYTHVAKRKTLAITSPIDTIDREESIIINEKDKIIDI